MKTTKSKKEGKAEKNRFKEMALKNDPKSKENILASSGYALRDAVYGMGIGGGLGYVVGKPAILLGFCTSVAAHFFGAPALTSIGVGMMSAGLYNRSADSATARIAEGKEDKGGFPKDMDTAKARFAEWKSFMKEKLFLDKLDKKSADGAESQSEETPPDQGEEKGAMKGLGNADPIDEIEAQLIASAIEFQQSSGFEIPETEQEPEQEAEISVETAPTESPDLFQDAEIVDFTNM